MKVCTIQPKYSTDYEKAEEYFEKNIGYLRGCDSSMDIIVLPESSDMPCVAATKEEAEKYVEKFNERILKEASDTAKRCNAIVFVNARDKVENGLRNTTFAFDRKGELVGKYFKQHPEIKLNKTVEKCLDDLLTQDKVFAHKLADLNNNKE